MSAHDFLRKCTTGVWAGEYEIRDECGLHLDSVFQQFILPSSGEGSGGGWGGRSDEPTYLLACKSLQIWWRVWCGISYDEIVLIRGNFLPPTILYINVSSTFVCEVHENEFFIDVFQN